MLALMGAHREGASLTAHSGASVRGDGSRKPSAQGHSIGRGRALALGTEPALVWGEGGGSDHFFPFEGGMMQEQRV